MKKKKKTDIEKKGKGGGEAGEYKYVPGDKEKAREEDEQRVGKEQCCEVGELTVKRDREKRHMKERYTERVRERQTARRTERAETEEKTQRALEGIRQLRGHYVSVHRIQSISLDYGLLL